MMTDLFCLYILSLIQSQRNHGTSYLYCGRSRSRGSGGLGSSCPRSCRVCYRRWHRRKIPCAAGMMASAASASGGGVLAGSIVAVLQSAGAAGLAGSTTAVLAGVGGTVGWLTAAAAALI
ncbi:hypothetical protein J4Q44_G00222920 [Coregonus suidteri]|uniref:Uncharacterized protein n=1 Tax=Coregonus suidteri TaxID=861788 RepID=A0AAN8QIE0_9TELE